jgi:hypothetical protein
MATGEQFDLEAAKAAAIAEIKELKRSFKEDSNEFGVLDDLEFKIENDELVGNGLRVAIEGVKLSIAARDNAETAYGKLRTWLTEGVRAAVKGVTEPLVPEKGHTEWRDVNVEIVAIAKAFHGTDTETVMQDLREKSHQRKVGKENLKIKIGDEVLDIKKGDSNEILLTKLSRFIASVKAKNSDRFPRATAPEEDKKAPAAPDKIFWRDVVAGIDGLVKAYPDRDYKSLVHLRKMLEEGAVAQGMHLLLSIGPVHLWIKIEDNEELIKEKIAVFIGELKQVASVAKKEKENEKPLDPTLDKTYWRDIEAALASLEQAFGEDPNFKLLYMSVKKGILGTVRNFHAVIGGETIDIKQTDTDTQMKDKLSAFIKKLNEGGQVKLNEGVRRKFKDIEARYHDLERQNLTLERRYTDSTGDLKQKEHEIVRLEDQIRKLQAELRRAQAAPAPAPPARYTTRSYSG